MGKGRSKDSTFLTVVAEHFTGFLGKTRDRLLQMARQHLSSEMSYEGKIFCESCETYKPEKQMGAHDADGIYVCKACLSESPTP